MTEADRPGFGQTLGALAVLPMYGRVFDDLLIAVYWRILKGLSLEAFTKATEAAGRTCKQFPTPAELLELARTSDPATDAAVAFERVLRLSTYSPHVGALWSTADIRAEIGEAAAQSYLAAGGAPAMRHALHNDAHAPYARKAFVECYERVVIRDPATAIGLGRPREIAPPTPVQALVANTVRQLPSSDEGDFEKRRASMKEGLRLLKPNP